MAAADSGRAPGRFELGMRVRKATMQQSLAANHLESEPYLGLLRSLHGARNARLACALLGPVLPLLLLIPCALLEAFWRGRGWACNFCYSVFPIL